MSNQPALFLDRDGTLIKDAHYLRDPDQLETFSEAGAALKKARKNGFLLFLHTNQSGIARGYFSLSEVHACNARMMRQFDWSEDFLTEICIAPEAPEELGGFRKPSPRFELEMARKYGLDSSASWVVGDKWSDAQTGLSAGMRGALVRTGKPIDRKTELLSEEKGVKIHLNLWQFVTEELGL